MLSSKVFENGRLVSGSSDTAKSEDNDCVVVAVANSFGINYDQAHSFVKDEFNRRKGKGTYYTNGKMKKLSKNPLTFEPKGQLDLFDNGVKTVNVEHIGDQPKRGGNLINKTYKHKKVAYTVKAFMSKYKRGNYFILVHKHALAIKDGVMMDNDNYRFDGYRRVVESAFKIN